MLDISIVIQLISSLLSVIPQIPAGVSAFVNAWAAQLPALQAAGVDVADFVEKQIALVKDMVQNHRDPTDLEWSELNDAMDEAHARLQSDPAPTP